MGERLSFQKANDLMFFVRPSGPPSMKTSRCDPRDSKRLAKAIDVTLSPSSESAIIFSPGLISPSIVFVSFSGLESRISMILMPGNRFL